ncbi:uncharacterized protein LOC132737465 [Ruditapes philippinarum]|uniref:uncharacterized protein LOC132737465 n=1 Tax=Ruditapes philippinarum TaxID=129788 RepID=UPI00295B6788|nr:uncharacterized protein LOC132737465 [Ruditapes philippinarum]
MKKHALCKNETTTLRSSEKSTSATTPDSGDSKSISPQSSTTSSTNSFTKKRDKYIKSSNYGIPIGVSVATFLLIVGAVIAVILTKRRGKISIVFCNIFSSGITPKCTMDKSLIVNNVYEGHSDSPYEQIDKVVPRTSKVAVNDVQEDNVNYAQVSFNLKQNATKTTGDMVEKGGEEDKGMYNTLKLRVKLGDSFDATYDTVEKAAMKLKTQHGTVNKSDENLTIKETDENPYNHLNEKLLKDCKTDNAYGVTQDIKNEYNEYSRKGHEKCLKDDEDMKNQTSRLQVDNDTFNQSSILQDVASTYNHKDTLPDAKDKQTHTCMLQDDKDTYNHTKALQDVGNTYNNTNSLQDVEATYNHEETLLEVEDMHNDTKTLQNVEDTFNHTITPKDI